MPENETIKKFLRSFGLIDRRYIDQAELRLDESRGDGQPPRIIGYAAVFNAEAQIMPGWREIVRPGAFRKTLRESDVRALKNHDPNLVLGRKSAGTLTMSEDEKGLRYSIDPPDVSYANDLLVSIRRGDITQSSFGFNVVKDRWTQDAEKKTLLRELLEVKLFDVSPVTFPAYAQTEVNVRSVMDYLIRKAETGAELDADERHAILAALDRIKEYFQIEPGESHSDEHRELEPGASDARHSDQVDGRDLDVLRKRLELIAV